MQLHVLGWRCRRCGEGKYERRLQSPTLRALAYVQHTGAHTIACCSFALRMWQRLFSLAPSNSVAALVVAACTWSWSRLLTHLQHWMP